MTPTIQARLRTLKIEVLAEAKSFCLFGREDVFALVERAGEGVGSIGGTGALTEHGLAYLVWRDSKPMLAAKGREVPAEPERVERMRRFSQDLKIALAPEPEQTGIPFP